PGMDYSIESFTQTDAAVNPGNSGEALVNLDGDLVGINTAIATETGSYQGYSFAIPSNLVRKVVADLIEFGSVQRAFIGVSIRDINAQLAEQYGLKSLQGALVASLSPDGAARKAGIQTGDVIIAVDGVAVDGPSDLQERVAQYRPGDQLRVTFLRGDESLTRVVTLRNENGTLSLSKARPARLPNTLSKAGFSLHELSEEELSEEGLRFGLRIRQVAPGGAAHKAGISPGMILLRIDKDPVTSLNQAIEQLAAANGRAELEVRKADGQKSWFILKY
ncbi:MAG: PDZ domain-containing protein, partial [Bacteroidetes bacterium]|nr:PDZ domain-containing protein [Bacteroidota bacterium]